MADHERFQRALSLFDYAGHIPGCAYDHGRGECDCGLSELERDLGPLREPVEDEEAVQ